MAWLRLGADRSVNLDYCVTWEYRAADPVPDPDAPVVEPMEGEQRSVVEALPPKPSRLVLHMVDAKKDVTLLDAEADQCHSYLVATQPSA